MKLANSRASTGRAVKIRHRRRRITSDDLRLSSEAKLLLEGLPSPTRPNHLPQIFPRVMNEIARLWSKPDQLDRYFDELLFDTRGGRQGFPMPVALELSTLKEYCQTEVYAEKACAEVYNLPIKDRET